MRLPGEYVAGARRICEAPWRIPLEQEGLVSILRLKSCLSIKVILEIVDSVPEISTNLWQCV